MPGVGEGFSVTVPISVLDRLPQARPFQVKIGSAAPRSVTEVDLEDVLRRTRLQQDGHRVEKLRDGWVEMFSSADGRESFGRSPAIRWIEASVSLGPRRFVLLDGEWYLRLDRRLVQFQPGRSSGIEICDLLGPDNELIHVKKASSSAPLSHLFAQGLVSTQALFRQADVRKGFAELVRRHGRGRTVPEDFTPWKIVFGILLKDGEELTVDTLFPFAQVVLQQAAFDLEGRVEIEVIGIRVE